MKKDIHDRLREFIEGYLSMSISAFEKKIGLSHGRFTKTMSEKKMISSEILEIIFSFYPKLDANWIFKGKGNMISEDISLAAEDPPQYVTRNEFDKLLEKIESLKSK